MSDIRFVAKAYLDMGWAVVPVKPDSKKGPVGWNKKVYGVADFSDGDNIAVKCGEPSGWLTDVDCDALEASHASRLMLPDTGLIHGRAGKPDSHYWFITENSKSAQYTDVQDDGSKGQMLIEVRSSGGYTVLPPSIHPSGEPIVWTMEREPLRVAWDVLQNGTRDAAIVSLLARHWPGSGGRHHFAGHLAGFFLQAKIPSAHVMRLIKACLEVARDPDPGDRIALVTSTIAKFEGGEKVTGGPKLADEVGAGVVARLRSWLKLQDIDAIEDFNRVHFFVRLGKDAVIGREDARTGVVFQQPQALHIEYANKKIITGEGKDGKPEFKPLFPAWLEHDRRRSYEEVVFAPPPRKARDQDYNLWQGYAVQPEPGDCSLLLEHLHENICDGNEEHFIFLMNLLAQTVQEPGTPSGIATVLRGGQGTGKGLFVRAIGDLFGRKHYTQLDKVEQLTGHFNAALSGKIIVFADEAFWAGDKREAGALKRLITEPTLHIVRKGIDGVDEDNHVHLFMATNNDWSWPADMDDRRGFLLKVSEKRKQDHRYFGAIMEQLKSGGLQGLLAMLLEYRIDRELLRHAPHTDERRVQQGKSLEPVHEWWHECLHEGHVGQLGWPGGEWIPVGGIYSAYSDWTSAMKRGRLLSNVEFGRKMGSLMSAEKTKAVNRGKEITRCLKLRALEEARQLFDQVLGSPGDWPEISNEPTLKDPF